MPSRHRARSHYLDTLKTKQYHVLSRFNYKVFEICQYRKEMIKNELVYLQEILII